jgi:hypothetical protein
MSTSLSRGALVVLGTLGLGLLAAPTPAHASVPDFPGVAGSQGWVDFSHDNRADWCMLKSTNTLSCTIASGFAFGYTYTTGTVDPGYQAGRAWTDVNGDGRADYCRVVGGWLKNVACTVANTGPNATGFGGTFGSGAIDAGYDAGRAWVDFNDDGKSDYCRVISSRVSCNLSNGGTFANHFDSQPLDPGWDAGRAWADVSGDGKPDYCRVIGSGSQRLRCTLSTGTGFGSEFTSDWLDPGYDAGRAWVDVTGDGKADYCRIVGLGSLSLQCTVSDGGSFGLTFTSGPIDPGYDASRTWVEVNADGKKDYCREVGWSVMRCTLATGSGFAGEFQFTANPAGDSSTRGWADYNGDLQADFCRVAVPYGYCTPSYGTSFGPTYFGPVSYP